MDPSFLALRPAMTCPHEILRAGRKEHPGLHQSAPAHASGPVAPGSLAGWTVVDGATPPRHCAICREVRSLSSVCLREVDVQIASIAGHKLCHADVAVFNDAAVRCHGEIRRAAGPSPRRREKACHRTVQFRRSSSQRRPGTRLPTQICRWPCC